MVNEELESMQMMGKAIATIALRNAVDAINEVFGPGSAKIDTPLLQQLLLRKASFCQA